jgi:hypothetical protein
MLSGCACMIFGQTEEKIISIPFNSEEKKALRVEMIEMDIAIRTIVSMISLNKPDRLEFLFKRLTELQMASSVYHKTGIEGVVKKWKSNGLMKHLVKIQSESSTLVDYLHGINADEKKKEIQWSSVYDANRKIIESCQSCHKSSGVEMK